LLFAVPSGERVERPYRNWLRLGAKVTHAGWQGVAEAAKVTATEGEQSVYDLDLSKMGNDALTVLAGVCGYHPAANELALRQSQPQLELA
jgi:hypothetical protein